MATSGCGYRCCLLCEAPHEITPRILVQSIERQIITEVQFELLVMHTRQTAAKVACMRWAMARRYLGSAYHRLVQ